MEEYTIIDVEQQVSHDTVIGKYAEHILDMHKKKYGDRAAQAVIERAVKIYAESQKQVENASINNNILLVGKVQSGKTSNLEMLSAIAFDNGYNMLIIYGGYDNTLLEQMYEDNEHEDLDELSAMDEEIRDLETERDKIIQIREGAMDDLLTGRVRLTK